MENLIPGIRNAARALVVRKEKILLLRKDGDAQGERYALPGGAQETGETLAQALNRECLEEIGTEIEIRDLLHVADWFKRRGTVPPSTRQLVEFLFYCDVPVHYQARNGCRPDKHQVEVVWKRLDELADIRLVPQSLAAYLRDFSSNRQPVYLGVID